MKKTIIINNGSTSKKYAFFDNENYLFFGHYEETPNGFLVIEKLKSVEKEEKINKEIFANSFSDFVNKLLDYKLIESEDDITSVAIRIVAPGKIFQKHQIVDDDFLYALDQVYNLSSLHLKPVKEEIFNIKERLGNKKILAISDSAFHSDLPDVARIYAIPESIAEKKEIYRYGYHGISVASVYNKFIKNYGPAEKIIVCHLGGGSSITAIKNGKSVDTSMGFSPLEGLPMASRIGGIDPNALITIMDSEDFDPAEMQNFMYKECGMLGISGLSSDTRVLIEEASKKNYRADLALNFYAYNVKKYIGQYYAVLGGLDAIIFTGTIGERSAEMRQRICNDLESLGIKIDLSKNKLKVNDDGLINDDNSTAKIAVLKTAEIEEMARIAFEIS
ncbi:MAG TPA: acetate/propionate family kinase [Candidatus Paceibacterota bacterium]|nr:acetate/propionate family kinase [Candidatus Paceibacterota bacterium]